MLRLAARNCCRLRLGPTGGEGGVADELDDMFGVILQIGLDFCRSSGDN